MSSDPSSIRVEHELFLRSFFASQPPQRVMRQFAAVLKDAYYTDGEVLFRGGDTAMNMYFIVDGLVSLSAEGKEPWLYGPSSVVGILDANLNRPYARTATALEETHALVLDTSEYYDIMEDNFDFARTVLLDVFQMVHKIALRLPPNEVFPRQRIRRIERPWLSVRRLNEVQKLMVLRASDFFQNAPIQPLVVLANSSVEKRLSRDRILTKKGDPLTHLWVVGEGRLRVENDDPRIDGLFEAGSLVLGSAAFSTGTTPYTVTADIPSLVIGVPFELMWDMMEDHFRLARCAFAMVAHENERTRARMAELKGSTRDLARQVEAEHH
ncbi:MAG: cyclic nucleotide-binding domain-containing protein [Myxococcota bacterium]